MSGVGARVFGLLAAAIIAFGSLVGPAPTAAAGPSPSAAAPTTLATTPSPTPTPTPSADPATSPAAATPAPTAAPAATLAPTAAPAATPAPVDASGLKAGATEVVSARTEYSQTYDNHDGTKTTQFFASPVFYKPDGAPAFQPISVGFAAAPGKGGAFVSDRAPVTVSVSASSTDDAFLSTSYGDHAISFRVPDAAARSAGSATPVVDGAVADYANLVPGVDLRVIANAHGAKSFFVWRTSPTDPSISYVVDAPGLVLVPQKDGSIAIQDASGTAVARIPTPYAVDSTPDERSGSGQFTDAVTLALGADGRTVTVSVDPAWLKSAVYPVYVDPSTGWVYNAGTNTYGDAHVASGYPTHNYDDYQRPDSPYYHELWNGTDPSGTSGTSYDYLKWSLSAYTNVTVDSASLRLYPYHQYYNSPTTETTYARRVTELWYETDVTWDTRPTYTSTGYDSAGCVEGDLCVWDVKAIVQEWLKGISPASNYGFQIDTIGKNSTFWKRFIASEQGGSNRPALSITYHTATVTSATPAYAGTVAWTYADSGGAAQAKYHVDVAATQAGLGSSNLATSGDVAGTATAWAVVPTTPGMMTDGTSYWYRVRAYNGTSWTAWVQGQFTYDAYRRGAEGYYTAVPFDLGGGWGLDVAVHNGEARLSRSLYSLPAFGPSQGLELTYDSLNISAPGILGYGWSSNLTQTLWLNNPTSPTLAIWNRPDASRVAFTGSGTTWTTVPGQFETLTTDGTEYTVTEPDQTRLVFTGSTGRLARIVDRFGKTLTFAWGSTSATITHQGTNQQTVLHYPGGSLVTSVIDPAGRTWTLGYTGSDLTSLTEPDPDAGGPLAAPSATFNYAGHLLAQVARGRRSAAGGSDTLAWDIAYTDGKVTNVTDAIADASQGGVASTFTYNASSTDAALLRTYSPATRDTTTFTFDAFGRVTQEADPNGFLTKYGWNAGTSTLDWLDAPLDASTWTRTAYTYDTAGNVLTETADAQGSAVRTRYVYDAATNDLLIRSDADNDAAAKVVTKYVYDAGGHLASVIANCTTSGTTPPADASTCTGGGTADAQTNLLTQYHYDTAKDLVDAERDPAGIATKHAYDALGNETSTVSNCTGGASWDACDASGTHDATTNVTMTSVFSLTAIAGKLGMPDSTTSVLTGRSTSFTYDTLGRSLTEVAPEGTTSHEWDQLGNELRTTPPGVTATTRAYDLDNHVTSVVAPLRTTTTGYDAAGNVVSQTVSGGTMSRTFDGAGRLLSETIDPGAAPHLNLTTQHAYDAAGNETATRNPAGTVTRTLYDALGRRTKTVENCTSSGTTVPDDATWAACTGAGTKDATWNLTTTSTYDTRGNLISETAPNGKVTTTSYDDLDRVVKVVDNDVASPTLSTQDITTEYAFDTAGNQTAVKSPTATGGASGYTVTRSFYDSLGRVTRTLANCTDSGTTPPAAWATCAGNGTKDAATNVESTYTYDADGHRLSVTAPSPAATTGTDLATVTTRYAYDASGRLCRVLEAASVDLQGLVDPCTTAVSGSTTTNISTLYTFDAQGNLASATDGRGNTTAYGYDDRARMTSLTEPGIAPATTWNYLDSADGTSTRTQTNRIGSTVIWTYDAAGRLVSRAYQDEAGTPRTTTYGYDAAGKLVAAVDGASSIGATNDRLGRPTLVTVTGDAAASTTQSYSFTAPSRTDASGAHTLGLDKLGNVTSLTDPGLAAFTFAYGAGGQQTGITAPNGNTTASTYDALGRLLTRTTGTRASYTETYNRAGNRLTEASTITGDPANGTATTSYDALGRLTGFTLPGIRTQSAGWQAVPNRDSQTVDGIPSTQTFDAANRPNAGGYTFDADGRMTARPGASGGSLEWDSLGRLVRVRVTPGGTVVAAYTYDALDRLRTVTRPGQTTLRFRYAGTGTAPAQVADDGTGTAIRNVAVGPEGTVLEDWLGTSRRLYGTNGHHDTTWTADSTGAVTATLRYDPWGNVLRATGSLPDWRWQGSWADTATNLEWAIARWYDPALGTFASADTVLGQSEAPASRHRYVYGDGDPIDGWDPSGHANQDLIAPKVKSRFQITIWTQTPWGIVPHVRFYQVTSQVYLRIRWSKSHGGGTVYDSWLYLNTKQQEHAEIEVRRALEFAFTNGRVISRPLPKVRGQWPMPPLHEWDAPQDRFQYGTNTNGPWLRTVRVSLWVGITPVGVNNPVWFPVSYRLRID